MKKEEETKEKKRDKNDDDNDDKKSNNNKNEMHTLFFGQMPFDTKAKDIEPWLKANPNRQGCGRDIGQIRNGGGDGEGDASREKFKGFAL